MRSGLILQRFLDGSNHPGRCGGDSEVVAALIWSRSCALHTTNWIDIVGYVHVESCPAFFDSHRICMRAGEVWGSILLCVDDAVFFVCVAVDA